MQQTPRIALVPARMRQKVLGPYHGGRGVGNRGTGIIYMSHVLDYRVLSHNVRLHSNTVLKVYLKNDRGLPNFPKAYRHASYTYTYIHILTCKYMDLFYICFWNTSLILLPVGWMYRQHMNVCLSLWYPCRTGCCIWGRLAELHCASRSPTSSWSWVTYSSIIFLFQTKTCSSAYPCKFDS